MQENRSRSNKRITQASSSVSPIPTPLKFPRPSPSENTTAMTDREPHVYLPLTEPISPVPLKSKSKFCKPSSTKPVIDQHHQTYPLISEPLNAANSPKPLDLTLKTCSTPKPADPPSSSLSSSSAVSSLSSLHVSIHADPTDASKTTQEDQYEVDEITCPTYNPTPVQEIRLKGLMLSQQKRIFLNVGGTKFETSVPNLQADPSSLLSHMVMPSSPI